MFISFVHFTSRKSISLLFETIGIDEFCVARGELKAIGDNITPDVSFCAFILLPQYPPTYYVKAEGALGVHRGHHVPSCA